MIYDKLPIILLSKITSLPEDSTNCRIASRIVKNMSSSFSKSIKELADECNVSISSISRFCRDIGLSDFFELKELIEATSLHFESASRLDTPKDRAGEHARILARNLSGTAESVDYQVLSELVADISRYEKITAFGLLKAETAAINLQTDLLMLNKFIRTKLAYDEQLRCLREADDKDLIIIFSYTGTYFEEGLWDVEIRKTKPRVYLVSSDTEGRRNSLIHRKLSFHPRGIRCRIPTSCCS